MKNEYEIRGNVTAIIINSPKHGRVEAMISTQKLQRADEFPCSWYAKFDKDTKTVYVHGHLPRVNGKQPTVCLHRWITNAPNGMVVDHCNHDTLNNTDSNLKILTNAENSQNRKGARSISVSGVRGVFRRKGSNKWQAVVKFNNKSNYIGSFDTIEEADYAATEARKKYMEYYKRPTLQNIGDMA